MKDEYRADYRPLDVALTLTRIRKLQGDRRYRDQHRLFFIEGVRNFVEAVDHKFPIETLLYSEKLLTAPLARKFVRQLKRAGVPFARVSPEAFRSISRAERASGIAAILHQRIQTVEQIQPDRFPCWTVLSQVQSLGNLEHSYEPQPLSERRDSFYWALTSIRMSLWWFDRRWALFLSKHLCEPTSSVSGIGYRHIV
jgi:RNA methyltransferase, TrmH family